MMRTPRKRNIVSTVINQNVKGEGGQIYVRDRPICGQHCLKKSEIRMKLWTSFAVDPGKISASNV